MKTMLDCQLEPPFEEPAPECFCYSCKVDMDWIDEKMIHVCPECEKVEAMAYFYSFDTSMEVFDDEQRA